MPKNTLTRDKINVMHTLSWLIAMLEILLVVIEQKNSGSLFFLSFFKVFCTTEINNFASLTKLNVIWFKTLATPPRHYWKM